MTLTESELFRINAQGNLRSRLFRACRLIRWYEGGTFNWRDTDFRVRFGLSATLFLSLYRKGTFGGEFLDFMPYPP